MAKIGNKVGDVLARVDSALCARDQFTPAKGVLFFAGLLGASSLLAVVLSKIA